MSTYVWCEDSGSGFIFWREVFHYIDPQIIVESKGSNSRLRKTVSALQDNDDRYYILMDTAVDNPDVLREVKRIKADISGKTNVRTVDIHSFEFALLSFSSLEDWIFAENDPLKDQRADLLEAREIFLRLITEGGTAEELARFKAVFDYPQKKNSEQIAARLLYGITRNTGFETDKGKIGDCFINHCCAFPNRGEDDICGLDNRRLSDAEKKKQLIECSVIHHALKEVDLYDNRL